VLWLGASHSGKGAGHLRVHWSPTDRWESHLRRHHPWRGLLPACPVARLDSSWTITSPDNCPGVIAKPPTPCPSKSDGRRELSNGFSKTSSGMRPGSETELSRSSPRNTPIPGRSCWPMNPASRRDRVEIRTASVVARDVDFVTDGYLPWFRSSGCHRTKTHAKAQSSGVRPLRFRAFANSCLCVRAENSHATRLPMLSQLKTQEFGALDIGHEPGTSNPSVISVTCPATAALRDDDFNPATLLAARELRV
jgi:hypothetical protein